MTQTWLLIHTKIGQEHTVVEHLQRLGHECYLPLYKDAAVHQTHWKTPWQPLFPRFVFIRMSRHSLVASGHELALDLGMGPSLSFRQTFITVDDELMAALREHSQGNSPSRTGAEAPADSLVQLNATGRSSVAALYSIADGETRVMELLYTLSKRQRAQPHSDHSGIPSQWATPLSPPLRGHGTAVSELLRSWHKEEWIAALRSQ